MMQVADNWGWMRFVLQLVTWGIVLFGWFFVSWIHENRDRSKSTAEYMRFISGRVADLMEKSIAHHTKGFDPIRFRKVTAELKYVSEVFAELRVRRLVSVNTNQMMVDLRRAITSTNYSGNVYNCLLDDDEIVVSIENHCHELIGILDRSIFSGKMKSVGFMDYFFSFFCKD